MGSTFQDEIAKDLFRFGRFIFYFCSVDDVASDLVLRGIDVGIQTIHGDRSV